MECETPYLIVIEEHPPIYFYGCIRSLMAVPFLESCYNLYYGELRKIIRSFLRFYCLTACHALKRAEDYKNTLDYNSMMHLFNKTVVYHQRSHDEFLKEFQPIESTEEQEKFDAIISLYNTFKEKLLEFGEQLKTFNKQDKVDVFAKDHFTICGEKLHQLNEYTHIFIAKWLEEHTREIRVSLEDIHRRLRINFAEYKKGYEDRLNYLHNELYELNKESVAISRAPHKSTQAAAVNKKKIAVVKNKIQSFGNFFVFNRLNQELEFWTQRVAALEEITTIIAKVKTALEKAKAEERAHSKYEPIHLANTHKYVCWNRMAENIIKYRTDLENKYVEVCRPLMTFFSARGADRIMYSDSIGSFYIDEYGHQNYITDYGAKYYHMNCEGQYILNQDNEKYYFDKNGRYVIKDGNKVYQLAPCTSSNTLTENGLWRNLEPCRCTGICLAKVPFGTCSTRVHNLNDAVLLPKSEVINIEKTLDSDTVKYLWHHFGWILPEVLNEVGRVQPRNPIHYLGHLILNKTHSITCKNIKERQKLAKKYREDIHKQRKMEVDERIRAWNAKQAKPFKASDWDDTADKPLQDSHQFAADLLMYYSQ
ncbi:unnamed protein product [Arctia plantaginis]|uniref:Uncharacterized protein n=1 Tax=Arctia plantaginis TaxID=874455 RepID=A0A8S1BJM2_ARCPL|nr:unnamed protein product [Arctia plantaginis]